MRVLIQRVSHSDVSIDNKLNGLCDLGYCLFVGFKEDDNEVIVDKMITKILNLRIFEDDQGKMNKSLLDVNGSILSISQFTLYADCNKGNRPSFTGACSPNKANELYILFNNKIISQGIKLETGIFGADMTVNITNIGPCTILLDSEILKF